MTDAEWIAFFRRPEIPAFNAAMLEHPDADLPRLVFADWVEENCPNAAFVAALRRSIASPAIPEWVRNFSMVVKGHELRLWRGRLEVGIDFSDPEFNYGPDEFENAAWESGWVGRLKLRGLLGYGLPNWLAEGRIEGIEWLDLFDAGISDGVSQAVILQLTRRRSNMTHVTTLDIRLNRITDGAAHRIAECPSLESLKVLLITKEMCGSIGRDALARSHYLPEHIRAQFRQPT